MEKVKSEIVKIHKFICPRCEGFNHLYEDDFKLIDIEDGAPLAKCHDIACEAMFLPEFTERSRPEGLMKTELNAGMRTWDEDILSSGSSPWIETPVKDKIYFYSGSGEWRLCPDFSGFGAHIPSFNYEGVLSLVDQTKTPEQDKDTIKRYLVREHDLSSFEFSSFNRVD